MEFGCHVALCCIVRAAISVIVTIINCHSRTSACSEVYSLALNMCSGSLLQMENLSGMKRAYGCSFSCNNVCNNVCTFDKTKREGMLYVGPFVPLSQMATVANKTTENCLYFVANSCKQCYKLWSNYILCNSQFLIISSLYSIFVTPQKGENGISWTSVFSSHDGITVDL